MLDGVFSWALAQSLVPMPFIGTVPTRRAATWLAPGVTSSLGAFVGAGQPRQADLLIVVGTVSQKAAPVLQRLHARMAEPAFVLHIEAGSARGYANVEDVGSIIPIDVVIRGEQPSADDVQEGLVRLREVVRRGRP